MENRKCPECGFDLIGRSDKKFCSDQCRNTFNNRSKKDSNNYVRQINALLRKNRRILEELNPNGKSKANQSTLTQKGFNFDYYTNTYSTKAGKTYYFCYEYGYLPLEDGYYALVKKQDYVDGGN